MSLVPNQNTELGLLFTMNFVSSVSYKDATLVGSVTLAMPLFMPFMLPSSELMRSMCFSAGTKPKYQPSSSSMGMNSTSSASEPLL